MKRKEHEMTTESPLDERREQILKAALRVFAKTGIDGTKMSMIAAEAGISQGLSYRYFSSKEEIFTILVQQAIEEAQASMRSVAHLPGSPKDQLRALTRQMLDEEHKHYFMLVQHAVTSKEVPEQVKQLIAKYSPQDTLGQLVPLFIQGQQMGEFYEGDPFKLMFLYFSVISGLMLQDHPMDPGYWLQEVDQLMRLIVKAT